MKKSLVLAMAMALGVTASAYAANPFSDVPAGHWAYDSVNKLAAEGVVEGYPDGTYGGDKLMTRYEMAQIVAKAMAKGANVDKLAAEFADELDTLGVRVANLEKKSDNVKITGEIRADYKSHHKDGAKADTSTLRSRLWITSQINEDWSYTGMIENEQDLRDNGGNEDTKLARAYVEGKLGGLNVTAGRWNEVPSTGNILDVDADGVKVSYGDKVKVYGAALKAWDDDAAEAGELKSGDRLYFAGAEANIGAFDIYGNYFRSDTENADLNKKIYNVGAAVDIAKDLNLSYEYMWGEEQVNKDVSKDGWVATLSYKGAEVAEPGSYGLHATYFDQPINAYIAPTTDATTFDNGYKGYGVGVDYVPAKNIQLSVNWYDTKDKLDSNEKDQVLYSELYFFF